MASDPRKTSITDMMGPRRRSSEGLLDTADDLVDKLDCLMDILAEIEDNYVKENPSERLDKESSSESDQVPRPNIFRRLKDGLDSTRSLIACLRREKWRLSKRQMSVELRIGELDDYKKHLKQDMTSMNDTVDMLSMRVIQLENALCEQQDIQESLELEKSELEKRLFHMEEKYQDIQSDKTDLLEEVKNLRLQRCDLSIQKENNEIKSEFGILQAENKQLKEMLRLLEEGSKPQNQDGGAEIQKSVIKVPDRFCSSDLDDLDSSDPENNSE